MVHKTYQYNAGEHLGLSTVAYCPAAGEWVTDTRAYLGGKLVFKAGADFWVHWVDVTQTCLDASGGKTTFISQSAPFSASVEGSNPPAVTIDGCPAGSHRFTMDAELEPAGIAISTLTPGPGADDPTDPQAPCKIASGGTPCTVAPLHPNQSVSDSNPCKWGPYTVNQLDCVLNGSAPCDQRTCEVAMRLLEASPAASFDKIVDTAKECEDLAAEAGLNEDACKTEDIFLPGADVAEASAHDYEAMTQDNPALAANQPSGKTLDGKAHPELVQLHYLSAASRQVSDGRGGPGLERRWYGEAETPSDYWPCGAAPRNDGRDCDEYPFYATQESGPPTASLKLIDASQNQYEGTKYRLMTINPRCGSSGSGMVNGDPFLVVPLVADSSDAGAVAAAPPTFFVCG